MPSPISISEIVYAVIKHIN